jgi:hypothetical protein
MPFYVYEIAARGQREERNWGTEKEARSALKHVAQRALTEGASTDDLLLMKREKTCAKVLKGH